MHHNEPKHHTASALPEVTMAQFQSQGGTLGGREERTDSFSGAPRAIGDSVTDRHHSNVLGGPGAAGSTTVTGSERYSGNEGYSNQAQGYDESPGYPSTTGTSKQTTRDYEYDTPRQQKYTDSTGSTTTSHAGQRAAMGAGAGVGGAGTAAGMASGGGGLGGLGSAAQSKHAGVNKESWMGKGAKGEKGAEEAAPAKKASIIDKLNPMKDTEGASVKPGFL